MWEKLSSISEKKTNLEIFGNTNIFYKFQFLDNFSWCIFHTHLIFKFLLAFFIFFLIGIHPCKAEQPLRGMELQAKKHLSFISLTASFDNIWNSIEYVLNLDDIWRYLSKNFDIWVERYLTIFNDNLSIFDDKNVQTWARKLSPKRYGQISPFIA